MNTISGPGRRRLFWICALVAIASALTSAGFSVAALSSSGVAHVNAMYAASRSLSLAIAIILVVLIRSRAGLTALSFVMALVQAGDAIIGAIDHDQLKTFGPAVLALTTATLVVPLFRELSNGTQADRF
jgi:hypothetical protein